MPEIIYDPRTKSYVDEQGNPVGNLATGMGLGDKPASPSLLNASGAPEMDDEAWKQLVGGGLKLGAGAASLAAPGGFAMRAGLASLLQGAGAGVEGQDPAMAAAGQLGAELGGAGLGAVLPRIGAGAGTLLGGVYRRIPEQIKAYMAERARLPRFGMNAIGDAPGFRNSSLGAGAQLQAAEENIKDSAPLLDLARANDKMFDKAVSGPRPMDTRSKLVQDEMDFMLQQARSRKGTQVPVAPQAGLLAPGQAPPSPVHTNSGLIGDTRLSARDLGEIKRTHAKLGENVIETRKARLPVTPEMEEAGQIAANRSAKAKEVQENLPGVKETVVPINQRLSDLAVLEGNANKIRGGGSLLTTAGQLTARGGLGYGVGSALGLPGGPAGLAGIMLLTPNNLSRLGDYGGRISEILPAAWALGNGAYDIQEGSKKVQRRKPGGKK